MSSSRDLLAIRVGASLRESMSSYYAQHDTEMGFLVARRCVLEAIRLVSEVHGRRAAYEMVQELADKHVRKQLLEPIDYDRDFGPAIGEWLTLEEDQEREDKAPLIMVPAPTGDPILLRNITPADALPQVKAAHMALQASERKAWPAWRRVLHDWRGPILLVVFFLMGAACS